MPTREITSQIERAEWDLLLQNAARGNYFQSPEFYDVLLQQNYLKPFVWAVRREDCLRALVCGYVQADGGVLKRYFTRRAIILGGVLIGNSCEEDDLTALMQHLTEVLRSQVIYMEVRNFMDYSSWKLPMQKAHFAYVPHYDAHVDCSDIQGMLQRMNKRRQRQIRAEQRQAHTWRHVSNPQEVEIFYKHLQQLYRSKVKRPLLPLSVFKAALRSPYVHLLVTERDKVLTGGLLCVKWNKVCYAWYEWGEMFTTWAGMEWAHQEGCLLFDFMGAGAPSVHYGVRDFKCSMGAELKEVGRFRYVANPTLYAIGTWVVEARGFRR